MDEKLKMLKAAGTEFLGKEIYLIPKYMGAEEKQYYSCEKRERSEYRMTDAEKSTCELQAELEELEKELEWQVSHKRLAYLRERIEGIETELQKRNPIVAISGHGMSWASKLQTLAEKIGKKE